MTASAARRLKVDDLFSTPDGRTWSVYGRYDGFSLTASSAGLYDTFDADRLIGCDPVQRPIETQLLFDETLWGG